MAEFSLFGYGYGGVPGEVSLWLHQPGEVERLACEAIAACQVAANRRRRNPGDQWATLLFLMVAWHNKENLTIPPIVLEALANVMGLVSYETMQPSPSKKVVAKLGLPAQLERWNMHKFLDAAKLDGEADAAGMKLSAKAMAPALLVDERSIREWRKLDAYEARRKFVRAGAGSLPAAPAWGISKQEAWVRSRLAAG